MSNTLISFKKHYSQTKYLTVLHNAKKLTYAFPFLLIDYCNLLCTGLPKKLIDRRQLVQKTSVQVLVSTRKNEHITSVLVTLHWLSVPVRTHFKALLLIFKSFEWISAIIRYRLFGSICFRLFAWSCAGLFTVSNINKERFGESSLLFLGTLKYGFTNWEQTHSYSIWF